MKIHKHMIIFLVSTSGLFFHVTDIPAQIPLDPIIAKPDLSKPDEIERPPMDPYSLSYIPEKPGNALAITDAASCKKAGGKWLMYDRSEEQKIVGCEIGDQFEGLLYTVGISVPTAKASKNNALGFAWLIHGQKTGWSVLLHEVGGMIHVLSHFREDKLDGASLTWDENAFLVKAENYREDVYDGKFEEYDSCLPVLLGEFKRGIPTGKWKYYINPGVLTAIIDYDRVPPADSGLPDKSYWTEWYDEAGHKTIEGYSKIPAPGSEDMHYVGLQQLYNVSGLQWIPVNYNIDGQVDDEKIFKLCMTDDSPKPNYVIFDHEHLTVSCQDENRIMRKMLRYYSDNNLWKIEDYDENGDISGMVREYHPGGEKLAEYHMISNCPTEKVTYYKTDGSVMGESELDENGTGPWRSYWHDGKIREEGQYLKKLKDGTWTTWFNNGSKESMIDFVKGKWDGIVKTWYLNGVLAEEIHTSQNNMPSLHKIFYTDGRIANITEYDIDSSKGKVSNYYHTGNIEYTIQIDPNNENTQTSYYPNGKKRAEGSVFGIYSDSTKHNIWRYYLNDESVWLTLNYKFDIIDTPESQKCTDINGKYTVDDLNHQMGCVICGVNRKDPLNPHYYREGNWKWWNENGKLEATGVFRQGHLHDNWTYYYGNGSPMLTGSYDLDRKIGQWHGYYQDGSEKFSGQYRDGYETGKWKTYYPGKSIVSSAGTFDNGKRNGKWVYHYPSGIKKEYGNMKDGKEDGIWTQYYESGKKRGEGQFVNGKRDGLWTWWRENGSVWRTAKYVNGRETDK